MIRMMATTIRSSMRENPEALRPGCVAFARCVKDFIVLSAADRHWEAHSLSTTAED
jgi:hypothetical protein